MNRVEQLVPAGDGGVTSRVPLVTYGLPARVWRARHLLAKSRPSEGIVSRVENRGNVAVSVPVVSDDLVTVDSVSRRLSNAAGRVALVLAPAGYGKTSQVATWARSDGRPVAWATVDPSRNDPEQFFLLVVGMLRQVAGVDQSDVANLIADAVQDDAAAVTALARLVRDCPTPFILVFDDVHIIDEAPVARLLRAVVDNLGPTSTVVLIGRAVPHLTLARLRLYAGLVDVSMEDLRLGAGEARRLLDSMGVTVGADVVERLVKQTEGWPVGIRLAALTVGADGQTEERTIGHDHAVADFVREEWLAGLPATAVEFLMRASCLERLSAPMCDDVFERSDSSDLLQLCERALMVIPLESRSGTVRVHPLVRDVLFDTFERCDTAGRRELDLRASEWFEQAGDIDEAIRLAVRSGQLDRAARLVDDHAPAYLTLGAFSTVNRWLGSVPTKTMISSAPLCITASMSAIGAGDPAAAAQWLRFADEAVARGSRCRDDRLHLETLRALVSPHADAQALADARHAYEQLPPGMWHALACFGYGVLSLALGDDETALTALGEGAAEARLIGAASIEAQCLANQAVVVGASNDLALTRSLVRSARALQREHDLDDQPALVMVTSMNALVAAMSGDVTAARADIALSIRSLAHLAPLVGWANIQARLTLIETHLLLDDRVGAQTLLDEIEPMMRDNPIAARSVEQFERLAAQLRAGRAALPYGPSSLTTAELRLLSLLPTNLTLAEIAKRIFVSRNTAKSHAAAIYRKLGVSTRGEAVEVARSVGLLAGDVVSPNVDRRSPAPT